MEVDIRHHRHFVCRRGQVLRELAEEYGGVAVSFPRTGVNSQRVTLKGAKECVEAAKKRIQEIIEDLVRGKNQHPVRSFTQEPSMRAFRSLLIAELAASYLFHPCAGVPGDSGGGYSAALPPRHHGTQRLPHSAHHQGARSPN